MVESFEKLTEDFTFDITILDQKNAKNIVGEYTDYVMMLRSTYRDYRFNVENFERYAELEEYLSKELYDNGKANQSAGKVRENKIKVKELYDFCVTLPRYEEVMKTTSQTNKRIIEPFERDLSVIKEFSWHYETEEPSKDFKEWLNTYIIITWNNIQPGIEEVVKGREKQQKKIENTKQ